LTDKLRVDQHETEEHRATFDELERFSVELNRASVSLILASMEHKSEKKRSQYRVVSAQLLSAINSMASILELSKTLSLHLKDSIALARIYYETCLSAAFIALDDGERAERAELYSVYKTFRSQTEVQKAGLHMLKVDRKPRLRRDDPRVKEALNMFSNGKSSRSCFPETREDMMKAITLEDSTSGLYFGGIEGMIFDVSSEIIHGSYHGYALFHGLQNSHEKVVENLQAHFESVAFSIWLSSAGLARILSKKMAPTTEMKRIESLALTGLLPFLPDDVSIKLVELAKLNLQKP
jgi:hypothetical protein